MGATVVLKNTHMGVATDVDGRFEMEIMPETEYLVFSFIGKKERGKCKKAQGIRGGFRGFDGEFGRCCNYRVW